MFPSMQSGDRVVQAGLLRAQESWTVHTSFIQMCSGTNAARTVRWVRMFSESLTSTMPEVAATSAAEEPDEGPDRPSHARFHAKQVSACGSAGEGGAVKPTVPALFATHAAVASPLNRVPVR